MKKAGSEIIKTAMWVSALILTLSVVVTGTILCSRLKDFLQYEKSSVIELAPEKTDTTDDTADTNSSAVNIPAAPTEQAVGNSTFKPGFEAGDDKVVWEDMTEVEIFKVTYDETGSVTVDGVDDKLLAPGTGNTYNFSLKNTGNVTLDYTLTAEVKFSDDSLAIPISVRMNDFDGEYLVGSKTAYDAPEKLNDVKDEGTLAPNKYANYALEWQWPFEGEWGDEFDTGLGNRAVNEDITMTVILRTTAEADYDEIKETPDTGDTGITVFVILAVLALAVMILLMILLKKNKEAGKENE